jgi:hypothetical protein
VASSMLFRLDADSCHSLCPKKDVCEPIFLPAQDAPKGEAIFSAESEPGAT